MHWIAAHKDELQAISGLALAALTLVLHGTQFSAFIAGDTPEVNPTLTLTAPLCFALRRDHS